jgi:SRSO17 transposase
MDLRDETGTAARFRAYAADLASVPGHADRVGPFEDYCVGLLSAEGRKSVEPLAAVTAPERTAAQHQSLLHLVAQAPWSDHAVLSCVAWMQKGCRSNGRRTKRNRIITGSPR